MSKKNSIYLYKYIEVFLCGENGKIELQHCNTVARRPQKINPKSNTAFLA